MKKILALFLSLAMSVAFAQSSIMRAELAPGSYQNVGMDATGAIFTTSSTTAGTGTATGTGAGSPVSFSTKISTLNSTTALLGANAVYTGTGEEVVNYAEVRVSVFSNVASATDGLQFQQSNDNTNWDNVDAYSIPAATGKTFGTGVGARYFRIVYTNGGTIQTAMRLQTTYHYTVTKASSVRPQDARTNDNDFEEILAYNMAYDSVTNTWNRSRGDTLSGLWVQIRSSATGGYSFIRLNTVATTTIKSGAGTLNSVIFGAIGTTSTFTCYDSLTATGTVIFNATTTALVPNAVFNAAFTTGLTCIQAGAAAADITVTYK